MFRFCGNFHPSPPRFESRPNPGKGIGPVAFRDHLEWEVESILEHRIFSGRTQYLLKWVDHTEPTWANVDQLENCAEMLREYQEEHDIRPLSIWKTEEASSSSPESTNEDGNDNVDSDKEERDKDKTEIGSEQRASTEIVATSPASLLAGRRVFRYSCSSWNFASSFSEVTGKGSCQRDKFSDAYFCSK